MQRIQAEHPPFHASEASDSLYKTKLNVASFFLIGTFLELFSLSVLAVFFTSGCIQI